MLKRSLAKTAETTMKCNKATNELSLPLQPFPFAQEKKWKSGLIHLLQASQAGAISPYTEVWNEPF